jgi:hypothetical protein
LASSKETDAVIASRTHEIVTLSLQALRLLSRGRKRSSRPFLNFPPLARVLSFDVIRLVGG